ncbi:hypothetical protein C8R45DRAFT_1206866 [Mycena sanguinolenta]|nr:hypothetical protein C8R45DRAFT_1206866 [Mycena sanguinolenta]
MGHDLAATTPRQTEQLKRDTCSNPGSPNLPGLVVNPAGRAAPSDAYFDAHPRSRQRDKFADGFDVRALEDWVRGLATVSTRTVRRVAPCVLDVIRAANIAFIVTCLQLPSASPPVFPDFTDLNKVALTYCATVHVTRRLCATTGLPWWKALRDASVAGLELGEAMVAFGYRLSGTNDETIGAIRSIYSQAAALVRRARILARKRCRAVQSRLPRIHSTDVLFLFTFLPFPFEVPIGHLVYAFVLNGTLVSFLHKYCPSTRPPLEYLSPQPEPKIRRATKRYQRGRKIKPR